MSNLQKYSVEKLDGVAVDIDDIISNSETVLNNANSFYGSLDTRITEYFRDDLSPILNSIMNLRNNNKIASQAGNWLRGVNEEVRATEERTKNMIPSSGGVGGGDLGTGGGVGSGGAALGSYAIGSDLELGSANIGGATYNIDPREWNKMPASTKETFVKKLKQAGYTDKQIKDIIDGKMGVSKIALNRISLKLEDLYKKDPSIRQRIIALYGIDVFNADGTVNKGNLALIMLLDQQKPNDQYDIERMITSIKEPDKIEKKPIDDNKNTPNPVQKEIKEDQPTIIPVKKEEDDKAKVIAEVVSAGGVATGTMGAVSAMESVAETIATEQEKTLAEYIGDMTGSVGKIGQTVKPAAGDIQTDHGDAGIIAGAGLAAAGAAGGGGALVHQNLMKANFSPDDFYSLSVEDQNAIVNSMKKTGYTDEEISQFKESEFCIDDSFISDISKAVKKAAEMNEDVKKQIKDKYGYDLLDALNNTNKYKIFATAIIDGKNPSDDFNLYNILNPVLSEANLKNVAYFGLIMGEVVLTEETASKFGFLEKIGRTYKFTKEDYESQDDYTKSAMTSTLVAAGLGSDDIEKIKNETFKVKVAEMNPVIDDLEKTNEKYSNFAQKVTDLYKFSLIDAEGKIDKYRLFIAMIIDGNSPNGDYNIYKLIAEMSENEKNIHPEYEGLKINDVIVLKADKEEAQKDAENLGLLNMTNEELSEYSFAGAEAAIHGMENSSFY